MFTNKKEIDIRINNAKDGIKGNIETPDNYIIAKIIASEFDETQKIFLYEWSGGYINSGVLKENTLCGYGRGLNRAVCIEELDKDMTGKTATVKAGDIVRLFVGKDLYTFSVGLGRGSQEPLLDLIPEDKDLIGWDLTTGQAVKIRTLMRMFYSFVEDRNYEFYRDLYYDSNGLLFKIDIIQKVDGFETTLHEHAI